MPPTGAEGASTLSIGAVNGRLSRLPVLNGSIFPSSLSHHKTIRKKKSKKVYFIYDLLFLIGQNFLI